MKKSVVRTGEQDSKKQRNMRLQKMGLAIPDILLPAYAPEQIDEWQKWAVIACDQYTSEPEYWQELRRKVGDAPSTLQAILPEAEIMKEAVQLQEQIEQVHRGMEKLYDSSLLEPLQQNSAARDEEISFVLVCRTMASGRQQWGIVLAVDLECYEFDRLLQKEALIQPTEKTVLERLPVRKVIRERASLDFGHILLLYDDCATQLFPPLIELAQVGKLTRVYDFPLSQVPCQMNSGGTDFVKSAHGSVCGYLLPDSLIDEVILPALEGSSNHPLFLVGDGNHSLAAAKQVWLEVKKHADAGAGGATEDWEEHEPRRYALAELISFADAELPFNPIHRLVSFHGEQSGFLAEQVAEMSQMPIANAKLAHWLWSLLQSLEKETQHEVSICALPEFKNLELQQQERSSLEAYLQLNAAETPYGYVFLFACEERIFRIEGRSCQKKETVRVLQQALDSLDQSGWELDYVHGAARCLDLSLRSQCGQAAAILLPYPRRESFFIELTQHRVMPRKSFSIGHCEEKRFYIECRKLV